MTADKSPESKPPAQPRRLESVKKWGRTVIDCGFTVVPSALILKQDELDLDPEDVNILLHLLCSWWKRDRLPYLSKKTIAKRMGVNPSTVQRHVRDMERRGLLKRVERRGDNRGRQANQYDLGPLVEKLHPLAVALKRERAAKKNGGPANV